MIDLHNHILPDLDDGAADWEESLKMARLAVQDGIEGVVCTPHWMSGLYENTRSIILEKVDQLREKLRENKIPLEVFPGAELRFDVSLLQKIKSREVLTLNDEGRYALIELPEIIMPKPLDHFIWELIAHGIVPVIGHPERNYYLQRHPEKLASWVEKGVLVQVTASSLLGRFGKSIQEFSILLLERQLVHVVSTDSHGLHARSPRLSPVRNFLETIGGKERACELIYGTPKQLVLGKQFVPEAPLPITGQAPLWKKLLGLFG